MWGWEILNNKETLKVDPGQQAVNVIANAKAEDRNKAVEKKFPNPNKITEKLKTWTVSEDKKSNESPKLIHKESEKVLKDIQNHLSQEKINPGIDGQQKVDYKNYIEKQYTEDMDMVIQQINAANIGWSEYQKLLSPDAIYRISPLSIKQWATYVNYTIANNNFKNNSDKKMIDTPKLMKCFCEMQDILLTHTREVFVKNPTIEFSCPPQTQNTGEFIPIADKNRVTQGFQNLIDKQQEIVDFTLLGKADATGPNTREMPEKQITSSKQLLLQKWFDPNLLTKIELTDGTKISDNFFDGVDTMTWVDQKNKLNVAWAYGRALMQIDFLPPDQIALINTSQRFKIVLDPKPVNLDITNRENKWAEYTWGSIKIDTKGNESSTIITERENTQELQSFNQMQINFVAPTYYTDQVVNTWFLRLWFRDGKISISKEPLPNSFSDIQSRAEKWTVSSSITQAGGEHFWNWTVITLALDPKDPHLGIHTIPEPGSNVSERKPYYEAFSNAIQTYMNWLSQTTQWFVGFLQEYQQKTTNPAEKKYIENIIQVVHSYDEIDKKII